MRRHPWVTAGGAALPPAQSLPDADDPVNEFTFNEAANLATIRERISSPRGAHRFLHLWNEPCYKREMAFLHARGHKP